MLGVDRVDTDWLRHQLFYCDPEWSADAPDGFDHWPYFLRQRVTISASPWPPPSPDDGQMLRHSATCDIVTGLTDLDRATAICTSLNRFSAGWAYVVEPSEGRIVAHTSVDCPAQWQLPILRWIDAALISMWHATAVAPALADAVGGEVAVSFPEGAAGARTEPHHLMTYADSLRARPEWVLAPLDRRWADLGQTAAILTGALDRPDDADEGRGFQIPLESMTLTGRMQEQLGLGHGFEARACRAAPADPDTDSDALANALNWLILAGEAPGVAGAWTVAEHGELVFRAFTMDFALEHMLAAGVVEGAPEVLATIALEVASGAAEMPEGLLADAPVQTEPELFQRDPTASELTAMGVLASLWQPSIDAVLTAMDGQVPAGSDRRLLLLPRPHPGSGVEPIVTWGSLDGGDGARLTTLALVGTAEDDARLLVCLQRSPSQPDYRIRAGVARGSSPAPAITDAIAELAWDPPIFVDLTGCPDALLPTVREAFAATAAEATAGSAETLPAEWLDEASSPAAVSAGAAQLRSAWNDVSYD